MLCSALLCSLTCTAPPWQQTHCDCPGLLDRAGLHKRLTPLEVRKARHSMQWPVPFVSRSLGWQGRLVLGFEVVYTALNPHLPAGCRGGP